MIFGLYGIADTQTCPPGRIAAQVEAALRGGAKAIQLRSKNLPRDEIAIIATQLRKLTQQFGATFIINDEVAIAKAIHADGVHIGHHDAALATARNELGPTAIIGVSCYNDLARAQKAESDGANYVAFGRFFPSHTKPMAVQADLSIIPAARACLRTPIVAIGGIDVSNAQQIIDAGADAIAVIHGLFGQTDIEQRAKQFAALFANTTSPKT